MTETVLLLRLEGPLQSWGTRARWDVRDTQPEPTKSGVVGLLGCALGYRVGDRRLETELDAGLRFGVRVEAPGVVLEDYQTITGFLPTADGRYKHSGVAVGADLERIRSSADSRPATIISPRFYLQDAAFLAALQETGRIPGLLERCALALQNPYWPLFLGRKACIPSRPIFDKLSREYSSIEEALCAEPWSWLKQDGLLRPRPEARLEVFVEDPAGRLIRQDAMRVNPARQYGFRSVRRFEAAPAGVEGTQA